MTRQSYENITRPAEYDIFFAIGINKMIVFVNHRPCEPEIPFGPQVPPFPVSAVFSVSAVPFRQYNLAKRNGARRRTGLRGKGGRRGGWCRGRIRAGRRPPFPFVPHETLHHSETRQRQVEPPARQGTQKSRSRKLYKDGSFTK